MLARGKWVPSKPDADPTIRSYHLSSLYSPVGWFGWVRIVKDFLEAKGDQEALKTWTNTVLAETWKQKGEVPDYTRLFNRRENYPLGTIPKGAVFLTMGVDVQKDRMEYEVVAWGPRQESWSIEYGVHLCDPTQDGWHGFFDALRAKEWPAEEGHHLRIRMSAFDMGYQANHVYMYVRHRRQDTFAAQGRDSFPAVVGPERRVDVQSQRGHKIRGGAIIRYVGTNLCKGELYQWLRQEKPIEGPMPVGYCHFPQHPEEYFKQLTAEQLITVKNSKGKKVKKWDTVRERNEALDCRNYARAAASAVGLDRWTAERWEEEKNAISKNLRKKEPKRKYMHGRNKPWLTQ
jgi:phage terminase large subunit GpA-like protein